MNTTQSKDAAGITVLDAIRRRRNVREFQDRPVSKAAIEKMLDAARWAPNHRLTFPWRFFVLEKGGKVRAAVAELTRRWTYENNPQLPEKKRIETAGASAEEVSNVPAFVIVYSASGPNEEVTRENYATTCIAVQNMQLAAMTEGLAVGWSTGKPTRHVDLPRTLGADPSWQMVGALFIGFPASEPRPQRPEASEHTVWLP
ncbi:MAG: hypothetical protein FJ314_01515 [SAR202 cluster bacterium]|nr:hypothetical protein [SAR202 cluster bacterium]